MFLFVFPFSEGSRVEMHPLTFTLMEVLVADLGARVRSSARHSTFNCNIAFGLNHHSFVSRLLHVLSPTLLGWLGYDDDGLSSFGDDFRELGVGHIWC